MQSFICRLENENSREWAIKAKANNLTQRAAALIIKSVYGDEIPEAGIRGLRIEPADDSVTENLVVPDQLPGTPQFYCEPDHTVKITITRESMNNNHEPTYTDIVSIPARVFNKSCDGTDIRAFFKFICIQYAEATSNPKRVHRWNDIFCIPEDFLRRYGVDIEPVDTMLTMCVDMDSVL